MFRHKQGRLTTGGQRRGRCLQIAGHRAAQDTDTRRTANTGAQSVAHGGGEEQATRGVPLRVSVPYKDSPGRRHAPPPQTVRARCVWATQQHG